MKTMLTYLNIRRGLILVSVVFVMFAAWLLLAPHRVASKELTIGSRVLHVDMATTEAQRERGLGGRTSMTNDQGMLFVFPERGVYPFWMKDMQFPLDIVWIDHGTVTEVATLEPPANAAKQPQEYMPKFPADHVLEINADQAKKLGLAPGTAIQLPK